MRDTNGGKPTIFGLTALILFLPNATGVAHAQPLISPQTQHLIATPIRQIALDVEHGKSLKKIISIRQGEKIRLLINGKKAAVYHLHGYNLMAKTKDDHLPTILFKADYTGRYPLVLHQHDALTGTHEVTIAYIEITSR